MNSHQHHQHILDILEDVRTISFNMTATGKRLDSEQAKIEQMQDEFQGILSLKTEYDHQSQVLDKTIEKIHRLL
ncbi:MAG: hypothetical protein ACD_62C00524G0001 [uncultured bacterium]|nr:MAG: hypothetical protein ACD_62C00524G0001 [uncultured bacterium]HLD45954.1 hypothetical protein [bacterium]